MNKKIGFSVFYVLVSTMLNLLFTLVVIVALTALSFGVIKLVHAPASFYGTAFMISFMAGIVIGFIAYTKISARIIEKYNLASKFPDGKKKPRQQAEANTIPEEKKFVMPDSVRMTDEEKAEKERWGE